MVNSCTQNQKSWCRNSDWKWNRVSPMFIRTYVPQAHRLMILVLMFPMFPRNISQSCFSPDLYYPVPISRIPMFPIIPSPYVSQSLGSPISMLPRIYSPSPSSSYALRRWCPTLMPPVHMLPKHVLQSLCSPNMFPSPYVPQTWSPPLRFPKDVPQSLCFPAPLLLMLPRCVCKSLYSP